MNVKTLALALSSTIAFGIFATEYAVPEDGTLDEVIGKAANKDDVIRVAPGDYTTTTQYGPNLKAKLIGTGASRDEVVIRSSAGNRTLRMAVDSWLENVTVYGNPTSSKADKGGAIEMSGGTVTNCVITGGTAYGNNNKHCGGNLYLNNSAILVVDCEISGGQARKHGGNVCIDGGGTVRNCTITGGVSGIDSTTDEPRGANVYMYKGVLENCTITGGTGAERGGNVYIDNTAAVVTGCTIENGATSGHGGNIFMRAGTVSDCTLTGGSCESNDGGNVHMQGGNVTGCTISGGEAGKSGGNVYMSGGTLADSTIKDGVSKSGAWDQGGGNVMANPGRVSRCTITGGKASSQGGGIRSRNASTVVEDCLIASNEKGGVCLEGKGQHYNNTVVFNQEYGYYGYGSNPGVFVNNVVYGNYKAADRSQNEWAGNKPAAADMSNCAFGLDKLAGTDISTYANSILLQDDACFVDAANGDFRLAEYSVLEDQGATDPRSDASTKDRAGNPRTSGPVDIGCYEYQKQDMTVSLRFAEPLDHLYVPVTATFTASVEHAPADATVTYTYDFGDGSTGSTTEMTIAHEYAVPGRYSVKVTATAGGKSAELTNVDYVVVGSKIVYVDPTATPAFPYATPQTGCTTLAAALDAAVDGAEIRVADGVYEQTAKIVINKAVTVRGNDANPSAVVFRNTAEARSGSADHRVLSVENAGAFVSGLTLEGGQVFHGNGGNLNLSNGVVSNCVIRSGLVIADADAEYGMGGGVAISGNAVLTHAIVTENMVRGCASGKWLCGGAIVLPWGSSGKIRNCLIANNRWTSGRGEGKPTLVVDPADESITNTVPTVVNGSAGVLFHSSTSGSAVDNCTIVKNVIDGHCGAESAAGVRCDWNNACRNTVIAGNQRIDNGLDCEDQPEVTKSNVHIVFAEDQWKDGLRACMLEDPLPSGNESCFTATTASMFKNFADNDFRPRTGGSLIDRGIELSSVSAVDLLGKPRTQFKAIDIGCYECQRLPGLAILIK